MFQRGDKYKSPKLKARKKKLLLIRSGIGLIGVLLVIVALSFVSKIGAFSVKRVVFEGNSVVTGEELQQVVDRELAGNYLGLFSKRNMLLFPKKQIVAAVEEAFPRVEKAELELDDVNALRLSLTERKPYAIWCDSVTLEDKENIRKGCYFLDGEGLVFAPAPFFSGNVFFRYFGLLGEEPLTKRYLSPNEFLALDEFRKDLGTVGVPALGILLEEKQLTIFYVQRIEGSSEVTGKIFATRENFGETIENIDAFLADILPKDKRFLDEIEYLDMRFGNKVFYKKY
jgi:hypothetical protein